MRISLEDEIFLILREKRRQGGQWRFFPGSSYFFMKYISRPSRKVGDAGVQLYYSWYELAANDVISILEPLHLYKDFCDIDDVTDLIMGSHDIITAAENIVRFYTEEAVYDDDEWLYQEPFLDEWSWLWSFPIYYAAVA